MQVSNLNFRPSEREARREQEVQRKAFWGKVAACWNTICESIKNRMTSKCCCPRQTQVVRITAAEARLAHRNPENPVFRPKSHTSERRSIQIETIERVERAQDKY